MEDFRAGVTACLRSWSALRTAVESGWGGNMRESQNKAEDLRRNIFEIMDGSKCPLPNFTVDDLQDNLAIYMEEEFSVTLEDSSEKQVAETIFAMYEQCCNGNVTLARQLVSVADNVIALSSQYPVQIQRQEHDDSDDDDDEMMDDTATPMSDATTNPAMVDSGTGGQMMDTQQQLQPDLPPQLQPLQPPPQAATAVSMDAYLAAPLFGPAIPAPTAPSQPVRQLGETIKEEPTIEVDDDGFAPVKSNNRRNRRG